MARCAGPLSGAVEMCGIAAVWRWTGDAPFSSLHGMAESMAHRGPDGHGYALWSAAGEVECWRGRAGAPPALAVSSFRLGLGHRLLAIQDPSPAALQPMALPGGPLSVVYNGEIYNFPELRAGLAATGVQFHTATDTEVLLALWAALGPAALGRLRGMFAFALYDAGQDTLWVGRDRLGIKPVYFAPLAAGAGVVVASEFRAIHASGLVRREWREDAVGAFLAAGVNKPDEIETFFAGVRELPAGCLLRIRPGEITLRRYYSVPDVGGCSVTEADLPELETRFREVVGLHLRSTREVGVCLSGGLDSSNIAAAAVQVMGGDPSRLRTFTVGMDGSTDTELAAAAAASLGVRGHRCRSPAAVSLRDLAEMVVACETPNHTWGPINQFLLLRRIRQGYGVSVLLNGQGGDESLSGYPWFYPAIDRFVRERWGAAEASALAAAYAAREPLAPQLLRAAQRMYTSRRAWLQAFDGGAAEALGVSPRDVEAWEGVRYFLNDDLDWAGMRRAQLCRRELPHHLRHEDRLSMWFSIESRVPFVDHELVEWCGEMDPRFLYRDGYFKYPLRVLSPALPEALRWETRKSGYWEHHSAVPPLGTLTRRAVEACAPLAALVPEPARIERLSPLSAWRFLQMAVLGSGLKACSAGAWLEELSTPGNHAAAEVPPC